MKPYEKPEIKKPKYAEHTRDALDKILRKMDKNDPLFLQRAIMLNKINLDRIKLGEK